MTQTTGHWPVRDEALLREVAAEPVIIEDAYQTYIYRKGEIAGDTLELPVAEFSHPALDRAVGRMKDYWDHPERWNGLMTLAMVPYITVWFFVASIACLFSGKNMVDHNANLGSGRSSSVVEKR